MLRWFLVIVALTFIYHVFIKDERADVLPINQTGYNFDGASNQFGGFECTGDCSGHEAGYKWAEDNDIDDVDDCHGRSQSFIEGCEQYVEDNQ